MSSRDGSETVRRIDMTGKRVGTRVVLGAVGRGHHGGLLWKTRCDCGKEQVQTGPDLRGSANRSARLSCRSCWKPTNKLPAGVSAIRNRMGDYKRNAKRLRRTWDLTEAQFSSLVTSSCHYCGIEPQTSYRGVSVNGVDRLDNDQGYTPENCVACCMVCNRAKFQMPVAKFYTWVAQVAKITSKYLKISDL